MCSRAPYAPHDKTAPATKMTHPIDFLVCGVRCVTVAMSKRIVISTPWIGRHENTKTRRPTDRLFRAFVPSWLVHRPQREGPDVLYEKPTARDRRCGPG